MSRKSPHELPLIEALICERTGLSVTHLNARERARLLTHAMEQAGFSDETSYATFLRASPDKLLNLASQMSVGETYFFRDPEQLSWLTDKILPRLLVARPRDHVLKLWSAGCASGEEAYTLAMLLEERSLLARAEIVGTDISEAALNRARAGRYGSWSMRATGKLATQRYFKQVRQEFQLSSELMRHVSFRRQSLTDLSAALPSKDQQPFDLILCRNVLIYFTNEAQDLVSRRLAQSLLVGGTLLAGASDHFSELPMFWHRAVEEAGVSYTRLAPVAAAPVAPEPMGARRPSLSLHSSIPPAKTAASRRVEASRHPARRQPRRTQTEAATQGLSALERVRAVGKQEGTARAVETCREALRQDPAAIDLNLLLVSLLIESDQFGPASDAVRTLLYLDRQSVMGHLMSALLLRRAGEALKAARAYRRVVTLCAAQPDNTPVPLGEGISHHALAEVAAGEAQTLEKTAKAS